MGSIEILDISSTINYNFDVYQNMGEVILAPLEN